MIQRIRARAEDLRSDERGFSLVELLIVTLLLTLVLGATLSVLDRTNPQAAADTERGQAIRDVQRGVDRMMRELRQAYLINGCGRVGNDIANCTFEEYTHTIDFNVRTPTNQRRRVVYSCNTAFTGVSTSANAAANFRNCVRRVSTTPSVDLDSDGVLDVQDTCCTHPGTTGGEVIIERLLNWCRPDLATDTLACPTTTLPRPSTNNTRGIFIYVKTDLDGDYIEHDDPAVTADRDAITGRDPRLAEQVQVTVEVPSQGERRSAYTENAANLLLKDSAWLRNVDL